MASDADRLRAQRLYVESDKPQSDSAIAKDCGIYRETVKSWRVAGGWELEREEFWHRCRTGAAIETIIAATAARQSVPILTRIRGLEILASIAEDDTQKGTTRVQAISKASEIDGWMVNVQGLEQDNTAPRFVIEDIGQ